MSSSNKEEHSLPRCPSDSLVFPGHIAGAYPWGLPFLRPGSIWVTKATSCAHQAFNQLTLWLLFSLLFIWAQDVVIEWTDSPDFCAWALPLCQELALGVVRKEEHPIHLLKPSSIFIELCPRGLQAPGHMSTYKSPNQVQLLPLLEPLIACGHLVQLMGFETKDTLEFLYFGWYFHIGLRAFCVM